jgi:hypothetical protein
MNNDKMCRAKPSRRDVIVAAGASAIALTPAKGAVVQPTVASGFVFEDRSGTGQRQRSDPGLYGWSYRKAAMKDGAGWSLGTDRR